jgi:hypothetical protein
LTTNSFVEKITIFSKKIIILAKISKIAELKQFLILLKDPVEQEHIAIVGLLLLPYFFAPASTKALSAKVIKRTKKTETTKTISKSACQQLFLGLYPTEKKGLAAPSLTVQLFHIS